MMFEDKYPGHFTSTEFLEAKSGLGDLPFTKHEARHIKSRREHSAVVRHPESVGHQVSERRL